MSDWQNLGEQGDLPEPNAGQPAPGEVEEVETTTGGEGYKVILFNDDFHTMEEVAGQILLAIHCAPQAAVEVMLRVHNNGQAIVTITTEVEAERVAAVLREIALVVEVQAAG